MLKTIAKEFVPALLALAVWTLITGFAYPAAMTAASQALFPRPANGSLITSGGATRGSELIGQPFADAKYFWSRPSATGPFAYNAGSSSGSNLGPTNTALLQAVKDRVAALQAADPENKAPAPIDLVTASGSGLDPHISPAAALYQVGRVAKARNVAKEKVAALVERCTEGRTFGVLGEPRVNVLQLNLALDAEPAPAASGGK
jgi:K+-transporting ATPase ATPase C chain